MSEAGEVPPDYPSQWEADVVLTDGSVAHVRPIVPDDAEGIRRFHAGQSAESIYLRFFAPLKTISERDLHRFTHVDHRARVALVATVGEGIVGIGRYDRLDGPAGHTAEVAFNISDHYQGRGVGSVLLEHVTAIGQDAGVRRFVADVLPQNRRMIGVFADAGYEVSHEFDDGVIAVSFDIEPTEQSQAVRMAREHRAEAVSVRQLLNPRSVAVVGVSRRRKSIGRRLFEHLLAGGFTGPVHPVNSETEEVGGYRTVEQVSAIGEPVDLAIIAVPADAVLEVVRDCARAGVKGVVVVSAGFAEVGPAGEQRQVQLLRTARDHGMRVVGPISFGLINTDPQVRLNASLAPEPPPAGSLGLFAQSGALGITVLASAARRGLGLSTFASSGNRVDLSGNDLMQYWIDDEATSAVGLYLESMGNPRKFSRIARQLSAIKPVIVIKSGISEYGVPPGHRVRITRARPEAFEAMLRQAGVIRVENLHQLFDVAQLVVHQPLPAGPRVAIVTNSDALGALTADACVSWGLQVAHPPVTLHPTATGEDFETAMETALADQDVDSLVTSFMPPVVTQDEDVARAVARAAARHDKPCLATFLAMRGVTEALEGGEPDPTGRRRVVPAYTLPEDAVRALASATGYGQWRGRERGTWVHPDGIDRRAAHDLVETVLAGSPQGRSLTTEERRALLDAYGISVWPSVRVSDAEEAVAAARELGHPVVLKSVSPLVRHQQSFRTVRTDLHSDTAVRDAYRFLDEGLAPVHANRLVVQRMAPSGVACDLSTAEDPLFGPVVSFGVAGLPSDLLGDVGHRIPPLTDVDVTDLVGSVRAAPLLSGYRGEEAVDRDALEEVVSRVSVLADDLPEVAALRLNPVIAAECGAHVLGAEVTVAPAPVRADTARRTLAGP